jgi:CRP-like cAMP-binding protein
MPEALWVLLDGSVDVVVRGRKVAQVGPGHFVGEMSFVTGESASADTFVSEEVRAFAWPRQRLERVCRREPAAREALYAALGPDLARKILDVSHRPAPDEMAPAQRPAHGAPSRPVGAAAHFGGDGAS